MSSWFGPKKVSALEVEKLTVEAEFVLADVKRKLEDARKKQREAEEATETNSDEAERLASTLDLSEASEDVIYFRELVREVDGHIKELARLSVDVSIENVQQRMVDLRSRVYDDAAVRRNKANAERSRTATEHANEIRGERSERVKARIAAAAGRTETKEKVAVEVVTPDTNIAHQIETLNALRERHARLNKRTAKENDNAGSITSGG